MVFAGVIANAGENYIPKSGRYVEPSMEILAEETREGYVCRYVEFSSELSERVKAYLLVPDGVTDAERYPAVLMLHDHGARFDIGKEKLVRPMAKVLPYGEQDHIAVSSRQWRDKYFDGVYLADSLAASGYVVLVSDALYWGERSSAEAHRWSELNYAQPEHRTLESDRCLDDKSRKAEIKSLKAAVYEGQRTVFSDLQSDGIIWAEKILRDDLASYGLLSGLPYVDDERIGAFGFSMGAHRCWLLAAFCPGLKCGVALSWMTSLDGYESDNASDLSMRIQPMRDEMDFGDIGKFLAPKPMLFLNGEADPLFSKELVEVAFRKLHSHYAAYNKACGIEGSAPLRTKFFDGGHHCGKREQATIFNYFDEFLK